MPTPLSLVFKPREGSEVIFGQLPGGDYALNLGSKNQGFENADRWRDLIKKLHFTTVLRMFLTSENPRPRMALKMLLKPS